MKASSPVQEQKNTKLLAGLCTLVTGANSGIGEAIAREYAARGANVAVNYVTDREEAERIVEDIKKQKQRAIAVRADVSKEDQVKEMFRQTINEFGTIDVLVNNAGIQRDAPFIEMSLERWQQVIDNNLTGGFLCSREAVKEFLRRGKGSINSTCIGKIIFISSVHDVIPWAGHCNYVASKGGETMLMRSMAQELGPLKIRVNSIAPGAIETNINRPVWDSEAAREKLLELIPYKRIGRPVDVAQAAVWLASNESDYVDGSTIYVDGGMTLYPAFAHGG